MMNSEKITGIVLAPSYMQDRLKEVEKRRKEKIDDLDKSLSKINPELARAISKLSALQAEYSIAISAEKRIKGDLTRLSAGVELEEASQADLLKTEEKLSFLKRRINGLSLAITTQKQRISEIREKARDELIKQYKAEHKIAVNKISKAWEKLNDANQNEKEIRLKLQKILNTDESLLPSFQVVINTSRVIWLKRMKQYRYVED